jgi:hypothetical protein
MGKYGLAAHQIMRFTAIFDALVKNACMFADPHPAVRLFTHCACFDASPVEAGVCSVETAPCGQLTSTRLERPKNRHSDESREIGALRKTVDSENPAITWFLALISRCATSQQLKQINTIAPERHGNAHKLRLAWIAGSTEPGVEGGEREYRTGPAGRCRSGERPSRSAGDPVLRSRVRLAVASGSACKIAHRPRADADH